MAGRPSSLPASDGAALHEGRLRLSPETLQRAIETVAALGFVVLRAPAWWTDDALAAGSAAAHRSLEQLKREYT
eukprot:3339395-Prymnesium_polylepis.1